MHNPLEFLQPLKCHRCANHLTLNFEPNIRITLPIFLDRKNFVITIWRRGSRKKNMAKIAKGYTNVVWKIEKNTCMHEIN